MDLKQQLQTIVRIVQKQWNIWNIRMCIMVSVSLQVFLMWSSFSRKRHKSYAWSFYIWSAYMLGEWIAAYTPGQTVPSPGDDLNEYDPNKNIELFVLWAQFILLHLAGPDTIISFTPGDSGFWMRQLFGLVFQVMGTIYCFFQILLTKNNKLWIPTVLVFFVGLTKCWERLQAVLNASFDRFGKTLLPEPDPGRDYEEAVEEYRSTGATTVPDDIQRPVETMSRSIRVVDDSNIKVDEIDLLLNTNFFFNIFKVLFAGSFVSYQNREASREYFLRRHYYDAFRLIEYELSFLYDLMHTKVSVLQTRLGYICRFYCFSFVLAALVLFAAAEKERYKRFDIILTNLLFSATISLDIISFLVLSFSDGNLHRMPNIGRFIPEFILKRKRWSRLVFQYNMFDLCLHKHSTQLLDRLAALIFLPRELVDTKRVQWFSSLKKVTENLEEFIFNELKMKSEKANDVKVAKEACSQRGLSTLQGSSSSNNTHPSSDITLEWSIKEFHFMESTILWHLATELSCQNLEQNSSSDERRNQIKLCKLLSNYMFYLLMMKPTMLSPDMGNWSIVLKDTLAEMTLFCRKYSILHHTEACEKLIDVDVPCRPATVKGTKSKSLLVDACFLVQQLKNMEAEEQLMSAVWMELICFAAMSCSPTLHAEQPSRGGELLTFVWLLMYHLGLGTQFSEPIYRSHRTTCFYKCGHQ